MNLKMEILPNSFELEDGVFPFCVGKITIDDFWETFEMALDYWTADDYERQWREGLERIKTHDASCLVASIQDPTKRRYLLWWVLYKIDHKIFIRNELMVTGSYKKYIGKKVFSPETCYNFIRSRDPNRVVIIDGKEYEVSEWVIDFE